MTCRSPKAAASLSGGQKQAIGLARIADPQAEDPVPGRTDRAFRRAQRGGIPGAAQDTSPSGEMTIIVSTHRLSLLSLVDRLLVFDKRQAGRRRSRAIEDR